VAAVGSYLDARSHGGAWLLRMEDLDPPREVPGAAAQILKTLDALGFEWDGDVIYQSTRLPAYAEMVETLLSTDMAFPCSCSRSEIADSNLHGLEGPVYSGTCRGGLPHGRQARAIRMRVPEEAWSFQDQLQGTVNQHLSREIGDFVIRRADGCHAYQLAVVVDDAWQGITHVVRGADLLLSTPRQLLLQRRLQLPTPVYMHLPVAVNDQGGKLSKQTLAAAVDAAKPEDVLWRILEFLKQPLPDGRYRPALPELWRWAIAHWRPAVLLGIRELTSE
jgi:glutamyl-Q tRNA(Asp) synthetase